MLTSFTKNLTLIATSLLFFATACTDDITNPITGSTASTSNSATATSARVASTVIDVEEFCVDPLVTTLWAGAEQHIDAGTVTIGRSKLMLYLTVITTEGWEISESHLHIAGTLEGIPQTPTWNPKPGKFAYIDEWITATTTIQYSFSLDELGFSAGDVIYVAFHAALNLDESAWADGTGFLGHNWATYIEYIVPDCDPEDDDDEDNPTINEGDFRTQTQGGWGTKANGDNPGVYRDEHFAGIFLADDATGVTIGGFGGDSALFTSSNAVMNFLPQGKTPAAFKRSYTDPPNTSAGVLAGQVLALTLSVYFDLNDVDFGASDINLKDLVVADEESIFYGEDGEDGEDGETVWTVMDILTEANSFLGGGISDYTASELNEAISSINENFVDGTTVGDFLMLP
jgi:hypothetical protein